LVERLPYTYRSSFDQLGRLVSYPNRGWSASPSLSSTSDPGADWAVQLLVIMVLIGCGAFVYSTFAPSRDRTGESRARQA
jgi:hypothetical protein